MEWHFAGHYQLRCLSRFNHVSAHLPTCRSQPSSRQTMNGTLLQASQQFSCTCDMNHIMQYARIHEAFRSIHGSWEPEWTNAGERWMSTYPHNFPYTYPAVTIFTQAHAPKQSPKLLHIPGRKRSHIHDQV